MKQRKLGNQGLVVSELGLGCMGMSEFYGTPDEPEAIATIQRALDLGVTFLDTADMYGVGHNEELVGEAMSDRRNQVVLATKFGNVRGSDGSFLGVNGKPDYVRSAVVLNFQLLTSGLTQLIGHLLDLAPRPPAPLRGLTGGRKARFPPELGGLGGPVRSYWHC